MFLYASMHPQSSYFFLTLCNPADDCFILVKVISLLEDDFGASEATE